MIGDSNRVQRAFSAEPRWCNETYCDWTKVRTQVSWSNLNSVPA